MTTALQFPPPKITLVVATRNGGARTAQLLESLRASGPPADLDVVVVDDDSTDGTADLLGSAGVHVLRPGRVGPARARNVGAQVGSGDWVLFLDDDILLPSGFWDRAMAVLAGGRADVIGCADRPRREDGYVAKSLRYLELASRGTVERRYAVKSAALWVRRSAFEAVGGFAPERQYYQHEDTDLVARLDEAGHQAVYARDLYVFHSAPDLRTHLAKWRLLLRNTDIQGGWHYYRVPHALLILALAALAGGTARSRDGRRALLATVTVPVLGATMLAGWRSGAPFRYYPGILGAGLLRGLLIPAGAAVYTGRRLRGKLRVRARR